MQDGLNLIVDGHDCFRRGVLERRAAFEAGPMVRLKKCSRALPRPLFRLTNVQSTLNESTTILRVSNSGQPDRHVARSCGGQKQ